MNKDRIKTFADKVYADMAGAMATGMAYIGVEKGIFRAMAGKGRMTKEGLQGVVWAICPRLEGRKRCG